jgi:arginyl-tRNA synthetase
MHLKHELAQAVAEAIRRAQMAGDLPEFEIPAVEIGRPRDVSHGDYATPVALQLARPARQAPLKIAEAIVRHLPELDFVSDVSVAAPGFINLRLAAGWLQQLVNEIVAAPEQFGQISLGAGKKAQVECVSANPTGPITLGRTRGGVMGDTLARVMRAAGYEVVLEYYYNDAGRQITMLGESVKIRYQQLLGQSVELSADHYQGDYIIEIAQELLDAQGDALLNEETTYFGDYAKNQIAAKQRQSLAQINIFFDEYYREQSLYESGRVWEALETLRERGYVYEQDGAQWFRTTEFGDDKDRALVKATGEPTYRLPDIAYHYHKAQRGFDLVVDIFGPDHHAVAPQVLMGVKALGYDPDFVKTVLHQIVSLMRGGEQVKMSTRRGEFVTLDELVAEVGADPIRYFHDLPLRQQPGGF